MPAMFKNKQEYQKDISFLFSFFKTYLYFCTQI